MSSLTRWYIDTRHMTNTTDRLPLVETLRETDQLAVKRYLRLHDRHMSLASNLLKYYFIHKHCRIPWSDVVVSRTPKPHQRPCFVPTPGQKLLLHDGSMVPVPAIEFNVSHQASFVAIAGCIIPPSGQSKPPSTLPPANPKLATDPNPSMAQVGIDITCVHEPGRRRDTAPKTLEEAFAFIEIFGEVFSEREIATMKQKFTTNYSASSTLTLEETIQATMRLFYAYWALKEAYIKMTGEALLAPWLRQLEFTNVVPPAPVAGSTGQWGEPYTGVQTWLYGKRVEDVRVELVAFESDYMLATAARGANLGSAGAGKTPLEKIPLSGGEEHGMDVYALVDPWLSLESIDIERDIRPCATGTCKCLK